MVSVVVPIYNEQEILPELRTRLAAALDSVGEPWELILVNDGSRDRSAEIIRAFHQQDRASSSSTSRAISAISRR
jgi:glycosyltransferase involved in cell wall biosynthesis